MSMFAAATTESDLYIGIQPCARCKKEMTNYDMQNTAEECRTCYQPFCRACWRVVGCVDHKRVATWLACDKCRAPMPAPAVCE